MGEARRRLMRKQRPESFRAGYILIIEWLDSGRRTGKELHDALHASGHPVVYAECKCAGEVLTTLDVATKKMAGDSLIPIVHLESHGETPGLVGTNRRGEVERLPWSALAVPLRTLNLMCRFNLLVVSAACHGLTSIRAFEVSNAAPFFMAIGFSSTVNEGRLYQAMRELYRCIFTNGMYIQQAIQSANRELFSSEGERLIGTDCRRLGHLLVEGAFEYILDPVQRQIHVASLREQDNNMSSEDLNNSLVSEMHRHCRKISATWYAYDKFPENKARFEMDVSAMFEAAERKREQVDK